MSHPPHSRSAHTPDAPRPEGRAILLLAICLWLVTASGCSLGLPWTAATPTASPQPTATATAATDGSAQTGSEDSQADGNRSILKDLSNIIARLPHILLTALAVWAAIAATQRLLSALAERLPSRFRFWILPFVPILRLLFLTIGIFATIPWIINPNAENILAILGAAGLAIGFAFKDYVSSLIAGIVVIAERPYQPGDWITMGGDYGEVKSVGMRALRMVTPDDTMITIPHSKIWDNNIANANDGVREHLCVANFYLHPNHDAALARRLLRDVGLTSPYTQLLRPVVVIVLEKPWGTHYRLKAYPIDGRDEFQFISDLTVRGKAALREHQILSVAAPIGFDPSGNPPSV